MMQNGRIMPPPLSPLVPCSSCFSLQSVQPPRGTIRSNPPSLAVPEHKSSPIQWTTIQPTAKSKLTTLARGESRRFIGLELLIRPFCIMLLYRYLLHYGLLLHVMSQYLWLFSLILQGLHEEGECRQVGFWAGKGANITDLFCTAPKVLKVHGSYFWN